MSLDEFRPVFDRYEELTGRKLAGLRADTREQFDRMLLTTLSGTGIGRSAFVKAALDLVAEMDEDELSSFVQRAHKHEDELGQTCPWGQGIG